MGENRAAGGVQGVRGGVVEDRATFGVQGSDSSVLIDHAQVNDAAFQQDVALRVGQNSCSCIACRRNAYMVFPLLHVDIFPCCRCIE